MAPLSAFLVGMSASLAGAADLLFIESPGFEKSRHETLKGVLSEKIGDVAQGKQLCVSHGAVGADTVFQSNALCDAGVAMLAAAPSPELLKKFDGRVLVIGAEMDGVVPFSHFAAARHRAAEMKDHHFALIRGTSHASFASGPQPQAALKADLKPAVSEAEGFQLIAEIVRDFVNGGGAKLSSAEDDAAKLAGPVVDALQLEGSVKLGHPACNSDYATNPTCQYPKYPDHSLPFGPAPAPSPPLPSDCICGSKWVRQAAAMAYDIPGPYSSFTNDAFQDVSDTHPFHLPHIFNECAKPDASCVLNITTVTMPFEKAGPLWPQDPKSAPLSVLEFRTKFKSREAVRTNAKDPTASPDLDKVSDMCKKINQAAWDWALNHAEPSVKSRFESVGEPMVMVDDVEQTFGIHGPEWIQDELVFKRMDDSNSPTKSRIEVQSWKFVVGNANHGKVPWLVPAGMHYCKLLSPARAMEWIYTDSMRSSAAVENTVVV